MCNDLIDLAGAARRSDLGRQAGAVWMESQGETNARLIEKTNLTTCGVARLVSFRSRVEASDPRDDDRRQCE
jgi:hypothetical protein